MKTIFTTGQAAIICHCSIQKILRLFDSGRLRGFRIPGSRFRRIPREVLYRFLKAEGIPLDVWLAQEMYKVLLVGVEPNSAMMDSNELKFETAQTTFDAGIQIESLFPDCVVIDFAMGRDDALMIAEKLRKNAKHAETFLIGVLSDEDRASGFDLTIFNETFRKPFDPALLMERVQTLIAGKTQLV